MICDNCKHEVDKLYHVNFYPRDFYERTNFEMWVCSNCEYRISDDEYYFLDIKEEKDA